MLRVGIWDFKGEQDNLCGDEKADVYKTNVCQTRQRQRDTERSFYKQTLLGPSLSTRLVHTILIYGDSSLPGTGLLSTFFRQLGESQRFFLRLLSPKNNQAKLSLMEMRHI